MLIIFKIINWFILRWIYEIQYLVPYPQFTTIFKYNFKKLQMAKAQHRWFSEIWKLSRYPNSFDTLFDRPQQNLDLVNAWYMTPQMILFSSQLSSYSNIIIWKYQITYLPPHREISVMRISSKQVEFTNNTSAFLQSFSLRFKKSPCLTSKTVSIARPRLVRP